jgi:hypothetical protein
MGDTGLHCFKKRVETYRKKENEAGKPDLVSHDQKTFFVSSGLRSWPALLDVVQVVLSAATGDPLG